jgi:hypothetical protein
MTWKILPKPWWLFWTGADTCQTIGNIYCPDFVFRNQASFQHLLAHEAVHAREQEALGVARWLAKWAFSRSFRLHAEARGYAAQIALFPADLDFACRALTSSLTLWAAKDRDQALAALRKAA